MVLTPELYPTEAAVARIVAAEKRIAANIAWNHDPGHNQAWAEFEVAVANNGGWDLTLYGRARLASPYKRSYSLIWTLVDKGHRIFSLDVNGRHRNKVLNLDFWDSQTHKQIWRDAEAKFGYTPDEAIPEEPNAAFLEFCRECNIIFSGQLGEFPPT